MTTTQAQMLVHKISVYMHLSESQQMIKDSCLQAQTWQYIIKQLAHNQFMHNSSLEFMNMARVNNSLQVGLFKLDPRKLNTSFTY